MRNSIEQRNRRREAWMNLDPRLQYGLHDDYHSHMEAEIEKHGTREWAKERITHFEAETKYKLTEFQEIFLQVVAVSIGVVMFAIVPAFAIKTVADQARKENVQTIFTQSEGAIASAALAGGAVVGFAAHTCVCRILTSWRLQQSYEKAKEIIGGREKV